MNGQAITEWLVNTRSGGVAGAARLAVRRVLRAFDLMLVRPAEHRHHEIVRFLRDNDVDLVLDVGAHRGEYGRMLRYLGYDGRIVSFEPLESAFGVLAREAERDSGWTAANVALGATPGTAMINVAEPTTRSSLVSGAEGTYADQSITYVGVQEARVERLDDIVAGVRDGAERLYLKLDVQGYERQVLAGAAHTLNTTVGIQMEMAFVRRYAGESLFDEAVARMEELGYGLVTLIPGLARTAEGRIVHADGIFRRSEAGH